MKTAPAEDLMTPTVHMFALDMAGALVGRGNRIPTKRLTRANVLHEQAAEAIS